MTDELIDETPPEDEPDGFEQDLPKSEKAAHTCEVRKRIDELLERKRLKALLDDSEDWEL
ncbi:hypothetical protein SAMN05216262_10214 [Colwellia chukchiensis]|uniref:Uncharacterized protein n=1 Tax=Colwellia chukchiensis TaxID=641665 RepID=A0A1H7IS23_9GAMM|nr:hypothetical protein [Colwellia chukchiensis]SEK64712.1 hypothetical protein SAMN05216262_10214 [Colwellia chukchiensis]